MLDSAIIFKQVGLQSQNFLRVGADSFGFDFNFFLIPPSSTCPPKKATTRNDEERDGDPTLEGESMKLKQRKEIQGRRSLGFEIEILQLVILNNSTISLDYLTK